MANCPLCNDTKLLPFKTKEGEVIPFAFLDCECKEPPRDRYTAITPSDFDFACSDSWRGFYHEQYGGHDPVKPPEIIREREVVREVVPEKITVKHHYLYPEKKEEDYY